jgi:hypothetical protein
MSLLLEQAVVAVGAVSVVVVVAAQVDVVPLQKELHPAKRII